MLFNNLKIGFRNIIHQKAYSIINISGLSVSLAVTFLMLLWVQDEWTTDKFHENSDRIYRVKRIIPLEGSTLGVNNGIPYPVLKAAQEELPEVEKFVPLGATSSQTLQRENVTFRANGSYANSAYFEVFSFPVLQGNISQLDKKIDAIAISESLAKKIFGTNWRSVALGSPVKIHNEGDFTVEAIYEDFPGNSSLKNEFLYSFEHHLKENQWMLEWTNSGMQGAILLAQQANPDEVSKKIDVTFKDHQKGDRKEGIIMQKFEDQYLFGQYDDQASVSGGRIEYVRIFAIAAFLLLIIACINFVNLATARASKRAREVGVRKTIGASQQSLINQFMMEAGVISSISVILAFILALIFLPEVRIMTDKQLGFDFSNPAFWLFFLTVLLLTTIFSGAYPAFLLASFRPIHTLKGKLTETVKNISLRKGLVVFQFILAIFLIVGALVIRQQVQFIMNKNLGLNKDNLVIIEKDDQIFEKYDVLKSELLKNEGIASVTSAGPTPTQLDASTSGVSWPGKRPDQENIEFQILWVEGNFLNVFEIDLDEGKFYREDAKLDSLGIVLNQKSVEIMGLEDPIGETIQWWGQPRQIIGVVKDFNNRSLYENIEPVAILLNTYDTWSVFIRLQQDKVAQGISNLEKTFQKVLPEVPLYYEFVDEQYRSTYRGEVLMGKLANYFALIAVFISCLGLFGLATLLAEQKMKEIGIRKVLGASISNIVKLLSVDFLLLVFIAFTIASPIAYFLMDSWLEKFVFHTNLSWWVFGLAGILAIVVAFITVAFQSVRAAITNPVDSLRNE